MEPVWEGRFTGRTSQWAAERSQPGGAGEAVRHFGQRARGVRSGDRDLDQSAGTTSYRRGIWTTDHAGHVRKLLQQLGYSVQRPTTRLVQADVKQYRKWVRYTYPNLNDHRLKVGGFGCD